jgi:hypothetical protein
MAPRSMREEMGARIAALAPAAQICAENYLTRDSERPIFSVVIFFAGEIGRMAGAEGETAPETLRQKDRGKNMTLERDAAPRRFVHRRA